VGLFDGDGPNRLNADMRYDGTARVLVRPCKGAQLGASARIGTRDPRLVGYDISSFTTQGGYAFFRGTYRDAQNRIVHIMPSDNQLMLATDMFVPFGRFDLTSEFMYARYETREALDGNQLTPFTDRKGLLYGVGWYATLGLWIMGDRKDIGFPSMSRPIHLDLDAPSRRARHGLQALLKFEQLRVHYDGSARQGRSDPKTPNGEIGLDSITLGLNYWATKHVRVTVDWVSYFFGNRALAPAQSLPSGVDGANGRTLHELSARVGVQF
jgi:hypothetical protein